MTSNLKFPFLAALFFHAAALAGFGVWQPSIRSAAVEVTPMMIMDAPKEEAPAVKAEEKKAVAVKKEEKAPAPPKAVKPEPLREIKPVQVDAPQPVKEVTEEPAAEPVAEAPAPKVEVAAALPGANEEPSAPSVPAAQSASAERSHEAASHTGHSENAKQTADEMAYYYSFALQRIDRFKVYPRWAKERGFEGVVGVQFVVAPDGRVSEVKVVRPCHCDILNKAACEAVKKAAPFSPRPKSREGKDIAMEVNVGFRLD